MLNWLRFPHSTINIECLIKGINILYIILLYGAIVDMSMLNIETVTSSILNTAMIEDSIFDRPVYGQLNIEY